MTKTSSDRNRSNQDEVELHDYISDTTGMQNKFHSPPTVEKECVVVESEDEDFGNKNRSQFKSKQFTHTQIDAADLLLSTVPKKEKIEKNEGGRNADYGSVGYGTLDFDSLEKRHQLKFANFGQSCNSNEVSIGEMARRIVNDSSLYGSVEETVRTTAATGNSSKYEMQYKKLIDRFYRSIASNKTLSHLMEDVVDEEGGGSKVKRLYVMTRNAKSEGRFKILNACLLVFSKSFMKRGYEKKDLSNPAKFAEAQYQPNFVATALKMVWAKFHRRGITYRQADFEKIVDIGYPKLMSFFFGGGYLRR